MAEVSPIIRAYRVDNYAVIQLLVATDVTPDQEGEISGVGNGFDDGGTLIVACPQYKFLGVDANGAWTFDYTEPIPNQLMYQNTGADVEIYGVDPYGSFEYNPAAGWITGQELATYLGLTYASDSAFFTQCAAAASHVAYRRRLEANYLTDEPAVVPSEDVKVGTLMLGMAIYRQRGSIDQFASFTDMGAAIPTTGLSPMVKMLLGINRPVCA